MRRVAAVLTPAGESKAFRASVVAVVERMDYMGSKKAVANVGAPWGDCRFELAPSGRGVRAMRRPLKMRTLTPPWLTSFCSFGRRQCVVCGEPTTRRSTSRPGMHGSPSCSVTHDGARVVEGGRWV